MSDSCRARDKDVRPVKDGTMRASTQTEGKTMRYRSSQKILMSLFFLVAVVLSSCSSRSESPTPELEPLTQDSFMPLVSATGVVVPKTWAALSVPLGGIIEEIYVEEGDWVEKDQVLLLMDGREQMEANLTMARLELVQAQQAYDVLLEETDLVAAQAGMVLAQARDALDDAEYLHSVRQEGNRASQSTLDAARANLVLAENEVDRAEADFERVENRAADSPSRALALSRLAAARSKRDSILRELNWYTGHPDEVEQGLLDAEVALAEAQVQQAELTWERLKDTTDPRALASAEARLANAQKAVAAAEAALEQLMLKSPFSGYVTAIYLRPHEWVAPGQPILLVAELQELRIETTDLNEIDVAQIEVGDPAIVTFDAIPEVIVNGKVASIALKAAEGSGVNYTAVIELEAIPAKVLWGMTAFVDIEIE